MIATRTSFEKHRKINRFNPNSRFVLIGNAIDGRIYFGDETFKNFSEVQKRLPEIITQLKYAGEWDLSLYQVPNDFRIKHIYGGYYKKPNRGICIFNYNYMAALERMVVKISNDKIMLNGISTFWGIDQGKEVRDGFEVFESVYTVRLRNGDSVL